MSSASSPNVPAVPTAFHLMKEGVYTSLPGDYRSPVFSCTGFGLAEPQPFQTGVAATR